MVEPVGSNNLPDGAFGRLVRRGDELLRLDLLGVLDLFGYAAKVHALKLRQADQNSGGVTVKFDSMRTTA